MKKILLYNYIIILLVFILNQSIFGQTASPSSEIKTSSTSADSKAVENLKEKVANKVAEIRKNNFRAVAGKVFNIALDIIKIKKVNNEEYEIKLDEALTKYYKISGANQKEIKKEEIKKGDYLIVTGVINDKTIIANSIFIDQPYIAESGKIIEVDKENYNITVLSADKTNYKLSIETTTKQQIINIKTLDIERIGFSKIIAGDSVHFVVQDVKDENGIYKAEKILIVPQEYFMK